jgi:hypothetical protein
MLEDMPASLLHEWMAFYTLEPFGWQEEEYRAALVASVMANTARNPKKRRKPFAPKDFMRKERPTREQVADKVKSVFTMLARMNK